MTCCFRSSSKNLIQIGLSAPKILSLYLVIVPLIAFSSSSSFFIQFRRGIFNSFAFSSNDVLFIYYFVAPNWVTKVCFCLFSTTQIIHHHHSTCCIAGFLHQCIYTSQHILANGSFNFACRQSRPLTLPLHCNTCCWNILTIKICFNVFFPHCQLNIDVFTFSFSWFCY